MARDDDGLTDGEAHNALRRAHAEGRAAFFTDGKLLNHPGSPVWSAMDVFAPPLILLTSGVTLLFAFGILWWLTYMVLVLVWQAFGAPRWVLRRLHKRTVRLMLDNPRAFTYMWAQGGVAIAVKNLPERNCIAPRGKWKDFIAGNLMPIDAPLPEPQIVEQEIL